MLDEIHKMPDWRNWLKGVVDDRLPEQALLVTASARMETWRQSGNSLAGRYLAFRLHPISVRERCEQQGGSAAAALDRLLARGGFPEPCLAENPDDADRWRPQYFTDLIREDVVEFSRVHEINTMRLFVELLRERVGPPVSLASIARDLAVSPTTLKRYLDILQALNNAGVWSLRLLALIRQREKGAGTPVPEHSFAVAVQAFTGKRDPIAAAPEVRSVTTNLGLRANSAMRTALPTTPVRLLWTWAVAAALALVCLQAASAAEIRNVLVLYANSRLLPANVQYDQGLRETIRTSADRPVALFDEFLDVARFGGQAYTDAVVS
ncbi:MAG: ATP-binding protein [Candidatus Accumulibacter phosphatis]|nr:ATP-binding protein [Candidatus Accumulibacter phosphatis]